MRQGWLGFDGRVFLTAAEHDTYCRRLPVRFAAKNLSKHNGMCEICGKAATENNPLQASHIIPFNSGILKFWLTPDWLDSPHNLIWAHKKLCNKAAEKPIEDIGSYLQYTFNIDLPAFIIIEG